MSSPTNCLLIVIDCLRADHLGCYGYERNTSPFIDEFAQQGLLCEQFYSAGVPTQPSFTTLNTGQTPITHGIVAHKGHAELADDAPWLPSSLRQGGLTTADFCCLPRYKHWFIRGFEFVVDSTLRFDDFGYTASRLNRRAIPWLKQNADEPFFMAIHYWDPHTPYLPEEKFRLFYEGDPSDPSLPDTLGVFQGGYFHDRWQRWFSMLPAGLRDVEYLVSLYDGEVRQVDEGVGELLHALDDTGHREDTLVVLTSDHGELFYRHGILCDHHGLYDGNIHCPLLFRCPSFVKEGKRNQVLAGHEDLAPTILSSLGMTIPESMEGRDLSPLFQGGQVPFQEERIAEECTWQSKWAIRTREAKLILSRRPDFYGMPEKELYDLAADPVELRNVAEERPSLTKGMEERLEAWIRERMGRNGLAEDPVRSHGITLGKEWERWARERSREK